MSRYIDAEWLAKNFPHDEDWDYPVNTNSFVIELINKAPSIDITFCKDCDYHDTWACPMASFTEDGGFCHLGYSKEG